MKIQGVTAFAVIPFSLGGAFTVQSPKKNTKNTKSSSCLAVEPEITYT